MQANRPITDHLAAARPVVSVEFFPPKTEDDGDAMMRTAAKVREWEPDFVSITYGAGGGTRERTLRYARRLKDELGFEVMPHLTCVGHSKEEIIGIVREFQEAGFCNIMALRGDPPKGETEFKPHPNGCHYATELIELIRENFSGFCLGAGAYPEKHPEAPTMEDDLQRLKEKVDAGASFLTTQLFFNNDDFFNFQDAARAMGIDVPIIPGLMPVLALKQIKRFCGMCGSTVHPELEARLEMANEDAERMREIGIEWAFDQARELLGRGVPGLHLYILNRSRSAIELIRRLSEAGLLPRRTPDGAVLA